MSEKRFVLIEDDLEPLILDNKETMSVNEVAELLNEQQAIIQSLKEENEKLRKELDNFKPVMFQDVRKGTVILYSKGD